MPPTKPPRRSGASTVAPPSSDRPSSKKRAAPFDPDEEAYSEAGAGTGGSGGATATASASASRGTSVFADGSVKEAPQAEQLSYLNTPLPFKNPSFTLYKHRLPHPHPPTASTSNIYIPPTPLPGLTKTKKTAKQILAMEAYRGLSSEMLEEIRDKNEKKAKSKMGGGGIANLKGRPRGGAQQNVAENAGGGSARSSIKGDDDDMDIDKEDESVVGAPENAEKPKREIITYLTPQAPPSLLPLKKYCDITGLPARYTDPKTRLQYRGLEVWDVIRGLGPGVDQAYLGIRGAERRLV